MMSCNGCGNRNTSTCNVCIGWNRYRPIAPVFNPSIDISKEMTMLAKYALNSVYGVKNAERKIDMRIKKVIFNDPATVVLWEDGTKTIVKSSEGDVYDPEKGLAMAIAKKALGNEGNYYEVFKKWLPEEDEFKELPESLRQLIDDFDSPCPVDTSLAGDFDGGPVTLLTPEELAEKVGCSKATIQKRCREGKYYGAVKVGGKWRIPY